MFNFIHKEKPLSFNSLKGSKKDNFNLSIEKSFKSTNPAYKALKGDIYAIVYYFFSKNLNIDTDNLSKPIWDALKGIMYRDDKQIKIRIAGSFDLNSGDINKIDFSKLEGNFVADFVESFDQEEHVIYIECGKLDSSMYKFNLE